MGTTVSDAVFPIQSRAARSVLNASHARSVAANFAAHPTDQQRFSVVAIGITIECIDPSRAGSRPRSLLEVVHQRLEARMISEGVEVLVAVEIALVATAQRHCSFDKIQRALGLAQTRIEAGRVVHYPVRLR